MKKINRQMVMRDYNKLKKLSKLCYFIGLYSWAMDMISNAAMLMYNFNIIYCDDELEILSKKVSIKILKQNKKNIVRKKNKVVFYDYFSIDNRGVTEQYLQGLMDNDYEILYITLQEKIEDMHNIIQKINSYKKADIYFVKKMKYEACNEIVEKILEFQPSKILYHSAPWDVIGYVTLSFFDKSKIDRFLINLTDHAFWLGRDCVDYILEFRSYGANISIDHRNIEGKKLFIIPYYPIQNSEIEFQGFPFDAECRRIIFSGGSLYKIYGSTTFFDIVKTILNLYPDTIFYYLGNGNVKPLIDFIQKNQFENRFFYNKERKDINEVIKRCYFYLGTFPLGGGLMSQLAVANKKIPVAFTERKYLTNNIDELFVNNDDNEFTFYTLEDTYDEIKKLMESAEYYIQKTNELDNKLISTSEFSKLLYNIMENKNSIYNFRKYKIDINSFSQIYFDQENNYLHSYKNYFFARKNILVFILFPVRFFNKVIDKLFVK